MTSGYGGDAADHGAWSKWDGAGPVCALGTLSFECESQHDSLVVYL